MDPSKNADMKTNRKDSPQNGTHSLQLDKPKESTRSSSPEEHANIFSRMWFFWMGKLISLGASRPLQDNDCYELRSNLKAEHLIKLFDREFAKEKAQKQHSPSLIRSLHRCFGTRYWFGGFSKLFGDILGVLAPFFLQLLVAFINDSADSNTRPDLYRGYVYAACLFLCSSLQSVLQHAHFHIANETGMNVRNTLTAAVYQKILRLSPSARASISSGQIVNMMSTDCNRLDMLLQFFHFGWVSVIQLGLCLFLLIRALGPAALTGVATLLILFPAQGKLIKRAVELRRSAIVFTDARIKIMNEILQGIRILKMYAWEDSFMKKLTAVRLDEMKKIRGIAYIRVFQSSLMQSYPIFISLITFTVVSLVRSNLNAAEVFSSIVLFSLIRFPMMMVPMVIGLYTDAKVSLNRISSFLLAEELQSKPLLVKDEKFAIRVTDGEFLWDAPPVQNEKKQPGEKGKQKQSNIPSSTNPPNLRASVASNPMDANAISASASASASPSPSPSAASVSASVSASAAKANGELAGSMLKNINFTVPKGSLTCIVGAVGSGKSSVLSGLLGELRKTNGNIEICGTVAYCPQQAWIQNATFRDNILFGLPYDHSRYMESLRVCALERDLTVLPDGHETEIGEKGINLSGGQKQRVNLARAYYKGCDIILLDDPLSAVDAHVSKYLFEECLLKHMRDRTRVLVTHQLQYLPRADHVIVMKDMSIAEQGTYQELLAKNGEFAALMRTYGGEKKEGEEDESEEEDNNNTDKNKHSDKHFKKPHKEEEKKVEKKEKSEAGGLMTKEERTTGAVSLDMYKYYLKAMGSQPFLAFMFFVSILVQVFKVGLDFWLAFWTSDKYNLSLGVYLAVFCALGAMQCICVVVSCYLIARGCIGAAAILHERSFANLLKAPMYFFDTTPIGRILNRFSKDQDTIDAVIPESFRMALIMSMFVVGILVGICFALPWFLLPCIPFMYLYFKTQDYFRHTSRELKRLDSISKSPLFAHFSETLTGVTSIRAYNEENRFIHTNIVRIDNNSRCYYLLVASQRWMGIRLEFLGACIVMFCALFTVSTRDTISPGLAGLVLAYSLQITNISTMFVRQLVEMENCMNSVERSKFYIDSLPSERPYIVANNRPPQDWPQQGVVSFDKLTIRYREGLPAVLNEISISIRAKEKIGVVGRTGAGKSSMMLAIFRLVEAASGSISIDNIDISSIGLYDLRSRLAIIPQDPVLYSGTVRSNLDPFDKYSDDELWAVLERAYLKNAISQLEKKLEAPVTENGENFSVGQRCQMNLARAMLRRAKILILDEATASVDMETDANIQKSIRQDFNNCTILTIAHRLNTIIDYDRVLVLDFGRVVEFDSPANLLQNPNGRFTALIDETGAKNAAFLRSKVLK